MNKVTKIIAAGAVAFIAVLGLTSCGASWSQDGNSASNPSDVSWSSYWLDTEIGYVKCHQDGTGKRASLMCNWDTTSVERPSDAYDVRTFNEFWADTSDGLAFCVTSGTGRGKIQSCTWDEESLAR